MTANINLPASEEYPRVSVITPAYNRASLLDETIQSVLSQDYPNLEYIVLDDGSTDATLEVIKKYDGQIRWDSHPNMGETRTVNKGFSMATGEIIGVINSDDPLLPGAIRELVAKLVAEPDVLVVYPDWNIIDEHGKFLQKVTTREYEYVDMLRDWFCVPGPAAFFRHSLVKGLGGRDPQFRYVADFDFWLRAGLIGPFARVPKILAAFRMHPDNATSTGRGASMALEHVRLVKKIFSLPNISREALGVKKETFSSAYFLAATFCDDGSVGLRKKLYRLAYFYDRAKYFGALKGDWDLILPDAVPKGRQLLSAFFSRARNSFNWRRKQLRASFRSKTKRPEPGSRD